METAEKRRAIIFDVDGTLAKMRGRILRHGKKVAPYADWDAHDDEPVEQVVTMAKILSEHYDIIICSGRKDSSKEVLVEWLKANQIEYEEIFMRKHDDNRPDDEVKAEIYREYIEPYYEVFAVFDDRDRVVSAWRNDLNLVCFQVAEGNF